MWDETEYSGKGTQTVLEGREYVLPSGDQESINMGNKVHDQRCTIRFNTPHRKYEQTLVPGRGDGIKWLPPLRRIEKRLHGQGMM